MAVMFQFFIGKEVTGKTAIANSRQPVFISIPHGNATIGFDDDNKESPAIGEGLMKETIMKKRQNMFALLQQ